MVRRRKAGSQPGSKEKPAVRCFGQGPIVLGMSPAEVGSLSGIRQSSFSFLGLQRGRRESGSQRGCPAWSGTGTGPIRDSSKLATPPLSQGRSPPGASQRSSKPSLLLYRMNF
ncbi:hypothetical protein NL676_012360 [Syzygium grande]|nr:hypothetical protein NL676_012360 [Syzygium grande]